MTWPRYTPPLSGFVPACVHTRVRHVHWPGAGLLVDAINMITAGRPATATTEARDEDEMRKKIFSVLREGREQFFLDNARRYIDSAALASVVTARFWEDRILGESRMMRVPVRCSWVITANNARTSDEIARRILRSRIDPRTDQPEKRSGFRHADLLIWISQNRGQLVWACLTLVQAWIAAGRPEHQRTLGSFESFCKVIGGILDNAQIPGFLGNLDDMRSRTASEGAALQAFVGAWWAERGEARTSVAELFAITERVDPPLALGDGSERSQKTKLGIILRRIRDRQFRITVGSNSKNQDGNVILETIEVRVLNSGTLQGAQQWNLIRPDPTVNLGAAPDQGSPIGSRPQGIDFKDVREPREPHEPPPHFRAGEPITDLASRHAEHAHLVCSRRRDHQTGSQGSAGSRSPAFPRASDGEPSHEPQPNLTDRFTRDNRPSSLEFEAVGSKEPVPVDDIDFDEIEERLAIMMNDGGLTEAEARAELGLSPVAETVPGTTEAAR